MYMDDIKWLAKKEKIIWKLNTGLRIFRDNIGIEFGIEKCAMLKMISKKWQMIQWIELSNQGKI